MPRTRQKPAAAPPSKRLKSTEDPMLRAVKDALQMCSEIPDSARNMLLAGCGACLGTPVELRQPPQTSFVSMVEEALKTHLRTLEQQAVPLDEVAVQLEQATKALEDAKANEEEKEVALSEASTQEAAAKIAVVEKEAIEKGKKSDLEDLEARKALLLGCLEKPFPVIQEGGTEVKAAWKDLQPVVKGLNLEASLLTALPSSCMKIAEERGAFDKAVIEALGKSLGEKVKELEEKAGAIQGEDTLAGLKEAHDAATVVSKQAASDLQSAKADVAAAAEVAAKAKEAEKTLSKQREGLENFRDYYLECFRLLRDRTEKPANTEDADAAAPAAEEDGGTAEAPAAEAPAAGAEEEAVEPEPMLIGSS